MRYSAQQKQETRERIVRAASQHFRGRGWDGVAIADLMSKLNLTHGGVYRHFESKEELLAEAIAKGFEEISAKINDLVEQAPPGGELKVIIEEYLSLEHCTNPDCGCPMAALASEIARYPRAVRAKIDRAMRDHLKKMAKFLPGATEEERQGNCMVLLSGMCGAMTMARTAADNEMRQRILQATREFYIKVFCPQP